MTPEEKAVLDAAIEWRDVNANHLRETTPIYEAENALTYAVNELTYSCPQCNAGGHTCPGCGESIGHTRGACADCESAEWLPTTLLFALAGDRIRIGAEEADVFESSSGIWYLNTTDYWHPTPWKHTEVKLNLSANPGFQQYPPNTPCEIWCTPERRAVLALQQAFPGTEVQS